MAYRINTAVDRASVNEALSKRVLGEVIVDVKWTPGINGVGSCLVLMAMSEGAGFAFVGESAIQIPEYSDGEQSAMASTLALFYMQDIIVAPGDRLQIGRVEGLEMHEEDDSMVWRYRVTLECDYEGPGRLIGYRADTGCDDRVVLRGIGMKRVAG